MIALGIIKIKVSSIELFYKTHLTGFRIPANIDVNKSHIASSKY